MSGDNVAHPELPLPAETWCTSEMKFSFLWKIDKFTEEFQRTKNGESLCSNVFRIQGPDDMETQWKLKVYPKGKDPADSGYMAVFLCNETKDDVTAEVTFNIKDLFQSQSYTYDSYGNQTVSTLTIPRGVFDETTAMRGGGKFNIAALGQKPNITIACDVTICGEKKAVFATLIDEEIKVCSHLHKDLEEAFDNKELSDVQLKCGDKTFDCHQVILSARSPVFRRMFQAEMVEKKTEKVDIIGLSPPVVEEMLSFIYTGKTSKQLDELAVDLLAAAEQYQLGMLKLKCEESLCKSLSIKNCLNYLVIGDMYQAANLKMLSLQFIAINRKTVFKDQDWKDFLKDNPALLIEVIEALNYAAETN